MRVLLNLFLIASITSNIASPAYAGPGDGPVLVADNIVIQGTVRGQFTNGTQGGSSETCVLFWCSTSTTSTKTGYLNVNGIAQYNNSLLVAHNIVLQNNINQSINNKQGNLNYKGIMQIGR